MPPVRRKIHLDLMRIAACVLVIVNHTNSRIFLQTTPAAKSWWLSLTIFFFSKIAVPLFILISGAVLLGRQDSYCRAIQRLARILSALVLASLVYYIDDCVKWGAPIDLFAFVERIYHKNITNALWYLYLYAGMLVMLPILQRMAAAFTKRDFLYYLGWSFVFSGGMPVLIHYFPDLQYSFYFMLPLFNCYVALFLAGYYMERLLQPSRRKTLCAAAALTLGVVFSVILTWREWLQNPEDFLFLDRAQLLPIAATALSAFYLFGQAARRWKPSPAAGRRIAALGRLTFGVYLFSDLMVVKLEPWYQSLLVHMHPFTAVFLYQLGVLALALAVTFPLSHIPLLRKLL